MKVLNARHTAGAAPALVAIGLAAGCASVADRAPETIVLPYVSSFSENRPGGAPPPGWENWTLSRFKKPTQYQLVDDAGKTVVRASADASASGLVHRLTLDPKSYPLLSWRWKVDALIAGADNTQKSTDDSPVRVVVSFDGDKDKLPFDDRIFFDNIRMLTGQELPYATLVYIWENRAAKGAVIPNRHSPRIKMIVAESGRGKVGRWQEVTRNVYEDYQRAFGEEPGAITAVAIMTDTDNTGDNVHAWYGDILFRRVAPPRAQPASD
ncbi:MAG: DUF3047 domain-containing protein [Betaproteobacteria bacterium]|nr:DUF3047 domain-containing protein [Betaproteobacteria bacterium]